ncbi:hypothetical protein Tco_0914943, partial [Tanacetum coccineum]
SVMSIGLDSASSEVTYTSISSYGDLLGWAMDFFRLQEAEAAPASPEYEVPIEDQPYAVADSPIALSLGYIADLDPEEDSEDGPVDYPADGGDNDDDDSSDDEEEEEASEEEEAKEISIRPEAPILLSPKEEVKKLLALTIPPPSPLISFSRPSIEEHLARCLAAPVFPSSPLPRLPHPYGSPNHMHAPPDFRAAMGRLRASSLLPLLVTAALPLPSPPLPPLPSSPLPPLPDSLFIPPVDHREDIPKAELPPRKRLCLTTPTSRYEVGESSTVILRPTGGKIRSDIVYKETKRRHFVVLVYVDDIISWSLIPRSYVLDLEKIMKDKFQDEKFYGRRNLLFSSFQYTDGKEEYLSCQDKYIAEFLKKKVNNTDGEVGDEAIHKELGDRMERAATTASSLEAKQDSGEFGSGSGSQVPSTYWGCGSKLAAKANLGDNYYGKQYYHGEQLNASLMVSGLRCYTPVIGKITVVILVRDRCPRGKGNFPRLPIRTNIVRLATPSMGIQTGATHPNRVVCSQYAS